MFIVDYHDVYVPYLNKINALEGKGYASRSLFFLTTQGTLKPIAIELILPPNSSGGFSGVQKVFTPHDSNSSFQWILAKTHAIIIPACGFDSIPSDLAVYLSNQTLKSLTSPSTPILSSISAFDVGGSFFHQTEQSVHPVSNICTFASTIFFDQGRQISSDSN